MTDIVQITPTSPTQVIVGSGQGGAVGPAGPAGANGSNAQSFPVFSYQGTLMPYVGKNRFYFENKYDLTKIRVSLGTASSGSAVVIGVNINDSLSETVTVSPSTNSTIKSVFHEVNSGDYVTISIISVGSSTPGSDLTVALTIS